MIPTISQHEVIAALNQCYLIRIDSELWVAEITAAENFIRRIDDPDEPYDEGRLIAVSQLLRGSAQVASSMGIKLLVIDMNDMANHIDEAISAYSTQ